MALTVDNAEIFQAAITAYLEDVFTSLPGIVLAFNSTTCTANIRLAVRRTVANADDEGQTDLTETLPDLANVPILYPQSAAGTIRFPLTAGDPVLVLALWVDVTKWRLTGEVPSDPPDAARHHLKSCVAIPGFVPDVLATPLTVPNGIEVTSSGPVVVTAGTGGFTTTTPGPVALNSDTVSTGNVGAPSASITSLYGAARLGIDSQADTGDHFVALSNLVNSNLTDIATTLGSLTGATFGTPYVRSNTAAARVKAK